MITKIKQYLWVFAMTTSKIDTKKANLVKVTKSIYEKLIIDKGLKPNNPVSKQLSMNEKF